MPLAIFDAFFRIFVSLPDSRTGAFPSDALALLYHDGIAVVTPNFCTGKVDHDGRASGDISGLQFHALAAKEELAVEDRREARKLRQF